MQQQDMRRSHRERTLLPAKIFFNDKQSVLDCVIRDVSRGGAHLEVASTIGIPNEFTLFIPKVNKKVACRNAWSHMRDLGIEFVS